MHADIKNLITSDIYHAAEKKVVVSEMITCRFNASQTGKITKAIWMHCWIIIHTIKMQAGINFNHYDSAEYEYVEYVVNITKPQLFIQ